MSMLPSSRSNIITKGNDSKGARSVYQQRLFKVTRTYLVGIFGVTHDHDEFPKMIQKKTGSI